MSENNNFNAEEERIKNAVEFGKFSYELEEKREQSLLNQAAQMLVALSVFFVVVIALMENIVDMQNPINRKIAVLVFLLLITSLILVLLSQWRYKYQTMRSIDEIWKTIECDKEGYKSKMDFDKRWIYQIEAIQSSKKQVNDKRVMLLKSGMVVFLIAVVMVAMYLICLIVFN